MLYNIWNVTIKELNNKAKQSINKIEEITQHEAELTV